MNTKIIQTNFDNNPNYLMDKMLECITKSTEPYPNNSSVVNDPLRPQLQKLYNINMSMFDTHSFRLGNYQGTVFDDIYFIYEAPIDEVKKLIGNYLRFSSGIIAYPEGILLGFFPTEFRDASYRMEHIDDYAFIVSSLYNNLIDYYNSNNMMDEEILNIYAGLFNANLVATIIDTRGIDADSQFILYANNWVKCYIVTENNYKDILTLYKNYNYSDIGKISEADIPPLNQYANYSN